MENDDVLKKMFFKIVEEQKSSSSSNLEFMLDDFWKSIEDGSMFADEEIMQMAEQIVKANTGIMDNF